MARWNVLQRGKVLGFVHADAFQDALAKARAEYGEDVRVGAPADPDAPSRVQRSRRRPFDPKRENDGRH